MYMMKKEKISELPTKNLIGIKTVKEFIYYIIFSLSFEQIKIISFTITVWFIILIP